jgi:SAM-dependent methyltransferase
MKENNKKVSDFWSKSHSSSNIDIYSFLPTRKYFSSLVTKKEGLEREDWLELWFKESYLNNIAPVENCLSLCCGHGERDVRIAKLGYFKNLLSLDVSEGAIIKAKKNAINAGLNNITYKIADLNNDSLPENSFDLIYVGAGMHHIENLEHLVEQIHKSLRPGGLFICDEYIGPNYSNLSNRHREIINSVIHLIPNRLKNATENSFIPGKVKNSIIYSIFFFLYNIGKIDMSSRNSINVKGLKKLGFLFFKYINNIFSKIRLINNTENFIYGKVFDIYPENIKNGDPSEGVRASEIIPVLTKKFIKTDVHYYNGSILVYALDSKFFENFDTNSNSDIELLDNIINIEKSMINNNEIPPVHAAIICQKN